MKRSSYYESRNSTVKYFLITLFAEKKIWISFFTGK